MITYKHFLLNEAVRNQKRALKLLDHLYYDKGKGLGGSDAQMHNIIPLVDKRPHVELRDFEYNSKRKSIPVSTLVTGQEHVSAEVVGKKIRGTWKHHDPDVPWVVHHKGTHYLIDGNHRGVQARLEGSTHMTADVIDAPDDTKWHQYIRRK